MPNEKCRTRVNSYILHLAFCIQAAFFSSLLGSHHCRELRDSRNRLRSMDTPDRAVAAPPRLQLQALRKTFNPGTSNEVRALQGVDLSIEDGSFVVVIGTNGSGKSTLLNAIAGSFFVDAGTIA